MSTSTIHSIPSAGSTGGLNLGRHTSRISNTSARRELSSAPRSRPRGSVRGRRCSALMRAVFPKDAARRAFLKSTGASTALAALSAVFPLKTATDCSHKGRAREKGSQGRVHHVN